MKRLGVSWSRLRGVLERLGGVLKRLGALLQAIWPDAENVEKPLVFLALWSLGGFLERLGDVLELRLLPMLLLMLPKLLRSALGSIFSCFEALLERLAQF